MKERLRAPLAAAVAFLIGGGLAARGGAGLLDAGRFLFPYLWLFLAFEAARRRRRLLDVEAFLLGAAAGLLYDGAYAKSLQDGLSFLGIDWLSSAVACFDWGLVTVVALHAADAILPRPDAPAEAEGVPERAALVLLPAAALAAYLADARVGRTRFERSLGPGWLLADLLFAAAAWALARLAFQRAAAEEPRAPGPRLWALAAFCAWLPGAQLAARLGGGGWISFLLVSVWTAAFGAWLRRLCGKRARAGAPRRAAGPVLAVAAWRFLGAGILVLLFGPAEGGGLTASAFSVLVDLPTRLLFLSVFLVSPLQV